MSLSVLTEVLSSNFSQRYFCHYFCNLLKHVKGVTIRFIPYLKMYCLLLCFLIQGMCQRIYLFMLILKPKYILLAPFLVSCLPNYRQLCNFYRRYHLRFIKEIVFKYDLFWHIRMWKTRKRYFIVEKCLTK